MRLFQPPDSSDRLLNVWFWGFFVFLAKKYTETQKNILQEHLIELAKH